MPMCLGPLWSGAHLQSHWIPQTQAISAWHLPSREKYLIQHHPIVVQFLLEGMLEFLLWYKLANPLELLR